MLFLASTAYTQEHKKTIGSGYEFESNGKAAGKRFQQMYRKATPEIGDFVFSPNLLDGARRNLHYLSRISGKEILKFGNLKVSGAT